VRCTQAYSISVPIGMHTYGRQTLTAAQRGPAGSAVLLSEHGANDAASFGRE